MGQGRFKQFQKMIAIYEKSQIKYACIVKYFANISERRKNQQKRDGRVAFRAL